MLLTEKVDAVAAETVLVVEADKIGSAWWGRVGIRARAMLS